MGKKINDCDATLGLADTHLVEVSKAPHAVESDSEKATLAQLKAFFALGLNLYTADTVITSAEMLAINTTPKLVVPGVVGKIIVPLYSWWETSNPGGFTPYNTFIDLGLYHDSPGAQRLLGFGGLLDSTAARAAVANITFYSGSADPILVKGADLIIMEPAGNPLGGNFDVTFHTIYQLLTAAY